MAEQPDIDALAYRLWAVHPREVQDSGLTRQQWYAREIRKAFEDRKLVDQINESLAAELDVAEVKLHRIKSWCEAYPITVFPEPDFNKAHELLTAGGMTLDAISASNMRHVLKGVLEIINKE